MSLSATSLARLLPMLITAWPAAPSRWLRKNHNSEITAMGITQANSSDERKLGRTPRYWIPALSSMGTNSRSGVTRSVRKRNDSGCAAFFSGSRFARGLLDGRRCLGWGRFGRGRLFRRMGFRLRLPGPRLDQAHDLRLADVATGHLVPRHMLLELAVWDGANRGRGKHLLPQVQEEQQDGEVPQQRSPDGRDLPGLPLLGVVVRLGLFFAFRHEDTPPSGRIISFCCGNLGAMPTLAWACRKNPGKARMATQAWPWHPRPPRFRNRNYYTQVSNQRW